MNFPPWSYSSLSTFEQCPRKWRHRYVIRDYEEPPQEHLAYGIQVHKCFEDRVAKGVQLPAHLEKFEPLMQVLTAFPSVEMLVEHEVGLTEALEPTAFKAPDTWYRGVIDLAIIGGDRAILADYKSGQRRTDFTQLKLFAATTFTHKPEIRSIKMLYLWTKFGDGSKKAPARLFDSQDVTRDWTHKFWASMLPRVNRMRYAFDNNAYFEKPGPLCGWCYEKSCRYCPYKEK